MRSSGSPAKGEKMPDSRPAVLADLESLLQLFAASQVSQHATPIETARHIWRQTLDREGVDVFVSEEDSRIVATCLLITAPNLLRAGRKHGFLENVVTHPDYLRRGHGSAVVQAALESAWQQGCFHVLLQCGRQDPHVHEFYAGLGFQGGLRVGYVAHCPTGN